MQSVTPRPGEGWGRLSHTQRSCCLSFHCPGATDGAAAVKSVPAVSCLSKSGGKVCFLILCRLCFFHGLRTCFGRMRQKHLPCLDSAHRGHAAPGTNSESVSRSESLSKEKQMPEAALVYTGLHRFTLQSCVGRSGF